MRAAVHRGPQPGRPEPQLFNRVRRHDAKPVRFAAQLFAEKRAGRDVHHALQVGVLDHNLVPSCQVSRP
jgi:hypothetical protein